MGWTDLTFSFGSTLTSTKMTQLDDNLDALANNDAGSPNFEGRAVGIALTVTAIASDAASEPVTVITGPSIDLETGQTLVANVALKVKAKSGSSVQTDINYISIEHGAILVSSRALELNPGLGSSDDDEVAALGVSTTVSSGALTVKIGGTMGTASSPYMSGINAQLMSYKLDGS